MHPEWAYLLGHRPFEEIGSDIFLTVSPGRLQLWVADADVINQITTRRNDFPKPLKLYKRLDLYGKNVVSTEGSTWRQHRKVTAPSFSEKNNELVFTESLHHAQALLKLWTGDSGDESRTVRDPAADTMRFALYVISRAGFGVRVLWSHEEHEQEATRQDEVLMGTKPPPGHKLSYREALNSLLENIIWTQVFPKWFLAYSPFKNHKHLYVAINEWGKYMEELYEAKKLEIQSDQKSEGMDLFGALIKGAGMVPEADRDKGQSTQKQTLSDSDIFGNAFVFMLAGHETTANALHFSLVLLALNWNTQRRLQEDIDKTLHGKSISEWDYDEDFPKLFAGMGAAVMNETLRLIPAVTAIPKTTLKDRPQPITLQGRRVVVPGDCHVSLDSTAVHRHPRYWPCVPTGQGQNITNDLDQFKPERWLLDASDANSVSNADRPVSFDDEDLRGPSGLDTSSSLFKPIKGSYIPFSDGYRSCLGRRFSQVEILAVLAVIFREYSVELAIDPFSSDEQIDSMPKGGAERQKIWQKTADRANYLLRESLSSIITLQMRGNQIPLRLVKRGNERFIFQ